MEAELICINCKHFNAKEFNCKAFPKGIKSNAIISGFSDHSNPEKNQNNKIVFEEKINP